MKNACYNSPQVKVTYSNCLNYLTISQNPKDILFTIIYDKEKHEIVTVENLEPVLLEKGLKRFLEYQTSFLSLS